MQTKNTHTFGTLGITILFLITLPFVMPGCRTKCKEGSSNYPACLGEPPTPKITITLDFWNLDDDPEIFKGAIQRFENKPREDFDVKIEYKKFTNEDKYEEYMMSKMAEGEGPDIFAMHHSWFPKHIKKITPMPEEIGMNPEKFRELFDDVVAKVAVRKDEGAEIERVYGLPLYIDTLALYYNKRLFENKRPEGEEKPLESWEEIKAQAAQLTMPSQSVIEGYIRTGIAMGRSDNIRYAVDILSLLFLQEGVELVDENLKNITLNEKNTLSKKNSSREAMTLYKSFEFGSTAIHENWNQLITVSAPKEQELGVFVQRKVGMIFGYASTYQQLERLIKKYEKERDSNPLKTSEIGIVEAPQLKKEEDRNENEFDITLADFNVLTVSAGSPSVESKLAWEFLYDIATDQENFLKDYNEFTHKPSAMKSGISETQRRDKKFGAFSRQIQFSKTLPIMDKRDFKDIFVYAIEKANRKGISRVLDLAKDQMQCVLEMATEKSKIKDRDCLEIE